MDTVGRAVLNSEADDEEISGVETALEGSDDSTLVGVTLEEEIVDSTLEEEGEIDGSKLVCAALDEIDDSMAVCAAEDDSDCSTLVCAVLEENDDSTLLFTAEDETELVGTKEL